MNVVGLVSGGKDSVYNLMECVRLGHRLVALANLYPASATPDVDSQELDSFMFQTVGHNVVPALADCLGLPLFRIATRGKAVQSSVSYAAPGSDGDGDEVEDLLCLLASVKLRMPHVNAVASGAILSNYQRARVENVCRRLNLKSLAFLWQREQPLLLRDMIAGGIEAVVVKAATVGLTRRHVGKTIEELLPVFDSLGERYKMNVCGEGGEYETMTLYCPLYRKRIVIDKTVIKEDPEDCSVLYCFITEFHLERVGGGADEPAADVIDVSDWPRPAPAAPAAPPPFAHLPVAEPAPWFLTQPMAARKPQRPRAAWLMHHGATGVLTHRDAAAVDVALDLREGVYASGGLEWEVATVLAVLSAVLREAGFDRAHVAFVHLFVRDMDDFPAVNAVYEHFFGTVSPPSRSCVQVPSPPGVRVALDCVFHGNRAERSTLHVESQSAWAPLCIGPYCQANQVLGLSWLAGQIGLVPETMRLTDGGLLPQTELMLRNIGRVLKGVGSVAPLCLLCTVFLSDAAGEPEECRRAVTAVQDWLSGPPAPSGGSADSDSNSDSDSGGVTAAPALTAFDDDHHPPWLTREAQLGGVCSGCVPLVVRVPALPRGALIEAEVIAMSSAVGVALRPTRLPTVHCGALGVSSGAFACTLVGRVGGFGHGALRIVTPAPLSDCTAAVAAAVRCAVEHTARAAAVSADTLASVRLFSCLPGTEDCVGSVAFSTAFQDAIGVGCAVSVVPVGAVLPFADVPIDGDAQVAFTVQLYNIRALQTESWVRSQYGREE